MKSFSSVFYNTKNPGKYKKEKTYQKIKDYFLKISLTGDSKILFRCYDINNLDCTCYQTIKSPEDIFDLYEDMKMYETGSVLFNVITKKFDYDYSIEYNEKSDTITIQNKDKYYIGDNLKFELQKESITCLKEYILILCQTIKKLKDDSSNLKDDTSVLKEDSKRFNLEIEKLPNILADIENLKNRIEEINNDLTKKEKEIDLLKKEKESSNKLIAKNTTELNHLREENKNFRIAISDSQEDIEKLNKKVDEDFNLKKKMNIILFNKKYRTEIGSDQIQKLNLQGCYLGNVALKHLCQIEFNHLENCILSGNNLSDISPLENAKFPQLKEIILFFNKINDISALERVNFKYLTSLGLSDNCLSDITPLKNVNFMQLERLGLSNNNIKDINVLFQTNFKYLRELKLSNNEISDISILKFVNFPRLKSLILSNNYIKNINVLGEAEFPILLELKLSNNKIDDISKLKESKFKKVIKKLYLSHNNIKDIEPLICSSCKLKWEEDKISRTSFGSSICSFRSCSFKELKELKMSGNLNYVEKNRNKDNINYLKSYIKLVII